MTGRAAHPLRKASSIKTTEATLITLLSLLLSLAGSMQSRSLGRRQEKCVTLRRELTFHREQKPALNASHPAAPARVGLGFPVLPRIIECDDVRIGKDDEL